MHIKPGDAVLAVAAAVLAAFYTVSAIGDPTNAYGWAQAVLSWGFAASFGVLTSRPKTAAAALIALNAAWAAAWLAAPVNIGYTFWVLAVPVAVFVASRYADKRFALGVLAAACAWAFVSPFMWTWDEHFVLFYRQGSDRAVSLGLHWAVAAVAYLLGANLAAEHNARARAAEAKETRRAAARQQERQDIAREIHDVLGHSLTLIKAQANAGLASGREQEALRQINAAAGESLAEIRMLVRGLRDSDLGFAPVAGVGDVPALVQRFRAAGLEVTLDAMPIDVPPVTSHAIHRIVAEALTNATRHQIDPQVDARIAGGNPVVVEVASTGRVRPQPGTGVGLEGLRERAISAGGMLETSLTGQTFTVRAELAA